ncbi:endonuclease III domain-containing protein [Gloeobacter kilaueensis]|uniref:Endonuclease III n=1 Tax=Gloeobacter kilaueensis (strain ATCC BAA-2537 / CCAP 1431/1 / ULC 316 / JS1) TaxID=1183438 RepID=U5QJS2_GLOK1|nr:endonuclease III [Gloeobacter kilaueensis]AGY59242.1 endonuclease III [Gloeobacter kilaueensis JS1]
MSVTLQDERRARAARLLLRLEAAYPHGLSLGLTSRDPFEYLVATVLATQCKDERVNRITPALFARYPDAAAFAAADEEELLPYVRPTGLGPTKARNLIAIGRILCSRHGGQVPATMAELTALPGVARKIANLVLADCFGIVEGVAVDTHVRRISKLLGLTTSSDPRRIEQDLIACLPRHSWRSWNNLLVEHGRKCCVAGAPRCPVCPLLVDCPGGLALTAGTPVSAELAATVQDG